MLFTLILLQARYLSLGILGAVGFNHPDFFASDFPQAQRRESESKLTQQHPCPACCPLPSHFRVPAVCTGLIQRCIFNAGWFSSFLEN